MPDLVVTGGRLTDGREPCDVLVGDGTIEALLPVGAGRATEIVDATGCLVLPALVEAHCHLDKTLFGRPWVPHLAADDLESRIEHDRGRRTGARDPGPAGDARTGRRDDRLRDDDVADADRRRPRGRPARGVGGGRARPRSARRGGRAAGGLPPARAAVAPGHRRAAGRGTAGRRHRGRRARPGCRGQRGRLPRRGARPGRPPRSRGRSALPRPRRRGASRARAAGGADGRAGPDGPGGREPLLRLRRSRRGRGRTAGGAARRVPGSGW